MMQKNFWLAALLDALLWNLFGFLQTDLFCSQFAYQWSTEVLFSMAFATWIGALVLSHLLFILILKRIKDPKTLLLTVAGGFGFGFALMLLRFFLLFGGGVHLLAQRPIADVDGVFVILIQGSYLMISIGLRLLFAGLWMLQYRKTQKTRCP